MSNFIVDQGGKIALLNEIGHDVAWDFVGHGDATVEQWAEFNAAFELVKNGSDSWFHTDGDLYQGSTLMRVIRRKSDGKLFGFKFWEDGGKYGGADIEPNGDDHGFPSKYDCDDDVADGEEETWYVFQPVELAPLPAYKFVGEE